MISPGISMRSLFMARDTAPQVPFTDMLPPVSSMGASDTFSIDHSSAVNVLTDIERSILMHTAPCVADSSCARTCFSSSAR